MIVISTATCGDGGTTDPDSTLDPITGEWYQPTVATTWQWQLQGTINTNYGGRSV